MTATFKRRVREAIGRMHHDCTYIDRPMLEAIRGVDIDRMRIVEINLFHTAGEIIVPMRKDYYKKGQIHLYIREVEDDPHASYVEYGYYEVA